MSYKTIALALGLTRVLNASAEASVVFNIPEGETQCPTAGEFAELAGRTVVKRGAGRLVMTDTAAKDVDLVYEDGSLAFTRTLPETVTVSPDDGLGITRARIHLAGPFRTRRMRARMAFTQGSRTRGIISRR